MRLSISNSATHRAIHFVQLCLCDKMNSARRACFVTSLHCFSHWYIYIYIRTFISVATGTCGFNLLIWPKISNLYQQCLAHFSFCWNKSMLSSYDKLCLFLIAPVGCCSHDQNYSELLQPAQNCPSQPYVVRQETKARYEHFLKNLATRLDYNEYYSTVLSSGRDKRKHCKSLEAYFPISSKSSRSSKSSCSWNYHYYPYH